MDEKVGLSVAWLQRRYGDFEALRIAKDLGADAVDFDVSGQDYRRADSYYALDDSGIRAHYETVAARAKELGLIVSQTHGRCEGLCRDGKENEASRENARRDLLASASLGAPACVVHGVSMLKVGEDTPPKELYQMNYDLFAPILDYAPQYGVKVAVETGGRAYMRDFCEFFGNIHQFIIGYNQLKNVKNYADWFTVCVDTGHSNLATPFPGNPPVGDVIRMLGKEVTVLHIDDNNALADQHVIPLTGNLDWTDVLSALAEIGYGGVYNLEVGLWQFGEDLALDTGAFALKVMRSLLARRDNVSSGRE